MSDIVTDELEREIGLNQPLHTGMTKRVRARPGNLDSSLMEKMGKQY